MLDDIVKNHSKITRGLASRIKPLPKFEEYLRAGYYPFYTEFNRDSYYLQLERVIDTVIMNDIAAVAKVEYETLLKCKRLLMIISEKTPFDLNVSALSKQIAVSRDQLLKMLMMLHDAGIVRLLYPMSLSPKVLAKPGKILFNNTDLMQPLGLHNEIGTIRETFCASMLQKDHAVNLSRQGDILVDEKLIFEVGGPKKGFSQIADLPDSYVIADGIEHGFGNKIPLWLLGFLY